MTSVLAFVVAMLVTMALLPVFIRLGRRFAFVDEPAPRKVHATPIPRLGGPAILIGVVAAIALLGSEMPLDERVLLLLAGLIVLTMGVLDDRRELGYRPKLLAQIIAAVLVVYGADIHIKELSLPQTVSFPDWLSHPFSVIVIVGITNAVALSDGLDGLAGGIVFLCSAALALLAYSTGNLDAGLGAIALAGATFGFLRFNTHPASIFMGDGGSQFLGLAAAVLALETTQAEAGRISAVLPLFLLAIPIIDTAQVILVRLSQGRSPFVADRSHLHHRLLDLGLEHRHAVLAIYVVQCLFFFAGVLSALSVGRLVVARVSDMRCDNNDDTLRPHTPTSLDCMFSDREQGRRRATGTAAGQLARGVHRAARRRVIGRVCWPAHYSARDATRGQHGLFRSRIDAAQDTHIGAAPCRRSQPDLPSQSGARPRQPGHGLCSRRSPGFRREQR